MEDRDFLAEGATSKVFRALTVINDECVKQVALKVFRDDCQDNFMIEAELLANIQHDNIIKIIGSTRTKSELNESD